jgi:hypothetical protein
MTRYLFGECFPVSTCAYVEEEKEEKERDEGV